VKRRLDLVIFLCLVCLNYPKAQDTVSNGKALNIPFKKYGISIGNSKEFNGLRLNFSDRFVWKINGVNITLWPDRTQSFSQWYNGNAHYGSAINGLSIGFMPLAGSLNWVNFGILAIGASPGNLTGFSFGGIASGANIINGFSLSGLITQSNNISGVALSGLLLAGIRGINGVVFSGLAVSLDVRDINGVASSLGMIYCGRNFTGLGITGIYLHAGHFKGIGVAAYTNSAKTDGLTVALYNKCDELNGIQLGLLNYAGNNRKGLKMLPLINMHFARSKQ
jgi:hypothetical protein